jgi:hypothetical protein
LAAGNTTTIAASSIHETDNLSGAAVCAEVNSILENAST